MDMNMPMSPPSMPGGGGEMNMNSTMNMMMMQMSFYWGKDATILFSGWPNQSLGMYILALFFVFTLSFSVEVLSAHSAAFKPTGSPAVAGIILTCLHTFRMASLYLVMLAVMSFNVGIFIAAVTGHAVGFFVVKFRALLSASTVTDDQTKV